jgi:uncharacterized protein
MAKKSKVSKKPAKKSVRRNAPKKILKKAKKPVKRNDFILKKIPPLCHETETAIPILNAEGNVLTGVLHEPHKKSNTLIIAVHGWTGSMEQLVIKQACIELARAGYAAYRFDQSGNGDSEGRFEDGTPSKHIREIERVIEHFRSQFKRIILYGYSLGGSYALIAAERARAQGVILFAAMVHPERFSDRFTPQQMRELMSVGFTIITKKRPVGDIPYTITEEFIRQMKQITPLDAAAHLTIPVLIINGTSDLSEPASHAEEFMQVIAEKDLLLIGGGTHKLEQPEHLESLIRGIITWLGKHFR